MKRSSVLAVFLGASLLGAATFSAQVAKPKPLQIYVIDAEGGKAALYVSPTGQSVLVDSGNPGGRDTDRLMLALADAGVTKIDYAISTHYHVDHVGGLQELAKRVPIGTYVDHGPTVETAREQVAGFQAMYAELYGAAKHLVVKPGDVLPVTGMNWRIVTSAGKVITAPLSPASAAAAPNPLCSTFKAPIDAKTWSTPDDDQSVGSVISVGTFRAMDFGDLLWDHAVELACPKNLLGPIDLYLVSGHGADVCDPPPLIAAVHPRAAIMQNGTRKGGQPAAMRTLLSAPGFEDLWQLHWSYNGGLDLNSPGAFIANIDDAATIAGVLTAPAQAPRGGGGARGANAPTAATPAAAAPAPAPSASPAPAATPAPAAQSAPAAAPAAARGRGNAAPPHVPAYWIKVEAWADGHYTIANSRNGFTKTYNTK